MCSHSILTDNFLPSRNFIQDNSGQDLIPDNSCKNFPWIFFFFFLNLTLRAVEEMSEFLKKRAV